MPNSRSGFPFDAVLFDLDGTLVATDRFWPDAARAATLRYFADEGIERAVPTTADWMDMVGKPLEDAFEETLPDLSPDRLRGLMAACVEEEHARLARGEARTLPGVDEALQALSGAGVRLGIASNCGPDYLDVMMDGLGLARWIDEGRCLRMPGIVNKADMVADLLEVFGTRSAVMVGDRPGDRDAAWANGVPHVHIPRGYGVRPEDVAAEAVLDGMDQLVPTLLGRERALRALLERASGAPSIAVVGMPRAGKSLLARDLARLAPDGVVIEDEPDGLPADAYVVEVTCDEEVLVRRAQGERIGPRPVEELLDERLPAYRASRAAQRVDQVVDMTNPLEPK